MEKNVQLLSQHFINKQRFFEVLNIWETNPKLANKPKTRKQTQNSETKNRGAGVEHRGMCVECSKQTQNSQTTPKLGNKKSWGGR